LETRRRDWCNAAKETQRRVLDALLKDRDPEKAAETVKETVQRIKSGNVPLADLAINTQMTRNVGGYVNEGPHVAAVRKAMKEGLDFKQGDIITYVITKKGGSNIGDRAVVIDHAVEGDYDADYYINNQVLPAVMRILEALGYQGEELKGFGKQMTLDGW
jgi:DNA polymerase I